MTDVNRDQTPLATARTGLLPWLKHAILGRRDPVAQQLHELEQQGVPMTRLAHFFGGLLLIAFSMGSAVGICSSVIDGITRAGIFSWAAVPLDIVFLVSILMVVCFDVAALHAGFSVRLLAQRGATKREYIWPMFMIVLATILEGGTFIYMSWQYDDIAIGAVAVLVIVRGVGAPIVALYLNMTRPVQIAMSDIQYHTFRAAAQGVISDMIHIANDHTAPLDHKAELMVAAYPLQAHERERMEGLLEATRKHRLAQGQVQPRAIVRASYVAPEYESQEHSIADTYDAYRAMHEGFEDTDYPITDEIADEAYDDEDLFSTLTIPAVRLESALSGPTDTTASSHRARTPKHSGPARSNSKRSASMREFNRKLKSEAKAKRRADIRDAVYAILDEWHADGEVEQISDKELARRVAARVNFDVNPSGNTVARWRGPWRSSRTHKAEIERETQEQDSAPIADDIVAMLEQEHEEALV